MQSQLHIDIPLPGRKIQYTDKLLLIGSCFTEHIADRLSQHKFNVVSNPHGILFNPLSVADSLEDYVHSKLYKEDELFLLNELWNSWDHHTRFSDIDKEAALEKINASQKEASETVRKADFVIITLGSAFQYYLKENNKPVANNHRAPSQWFEKRLLEIKVIVDALRHSLAAIRSVNPHVNFVFTISPVRHIRDGVIENNRSKARLLEAVHQLSESTENCFYFPAYELVIDVLRDHRYYDIDLVHPNFAATSYVWERFSEIYFDEKTRKIMEQVKEITTAKAHRPRFPETQSHKAFLEKNAGKIVALLNQYPFLNLQEERTFFEGN